MKTALIIGAKGQDGRHLATILRSKGYRILAGARKPACPSDVPDADEIVELDLRHMSAFSALFERGSIDEVYNFAAFSSGARMFEDPVAVGHVNGTAVVTILEAIHQSARPVRFCQASSSEMFGVPRISPQNEDAGFYPRSPYGAAKLYAHHMIGIFRQRFGLFACSAILFNHESPLRPMEFVTRKVTHAAARIKLGLDTELRVGNLEANRDWGYAGDHVRAMWLMLQADHADDYVVATGITHSVRDLCEIAFHHVGLDFRDYVKEDMAAMRDAEVVQLVGDSTKARQVLGWAPQIDFTDLIRMMVDEDMSRLQHS